VVASEVVEEEESDASEPSPSTYVDGPDENLNTLIRNLAGFHTTLGVVLPVPAAQVKTKNVRPIRTQHAAPGENLSVLVPAQSYEDKYGLHLLRDLSKPKFSGQSQDWQGFVKQYEQYLKLVRQVVSKDLTDEILLFTLQGCLDEGTQLELQLGRDNDPNLTYTDFWQQLCRLHGYDISHQNRLAWEAVRLEFSEPHLTKSVFL